jgi:CMP/dCMP kinase
MSTPQPAGAGMHAITISRQYGSGGGEIAARLAARLHWQLVDHDLVAQVAAELGITPQAARARDEHGEGFVARLVSRIQTVPTMVSGSFAGVSPRIAGPLGAESPEDSVYQETLRRVVASAAEHGQAVIVGRGAQVLLVERRDVLHVRIVAPLAARIAYVAQREGLDAAHAQARIELKDRDRSRYLQQQYHRQVEDPLLYDLVINTGVLALDQAVALIGQALAGKGQALAVPAEELGPVRGVARYPGPPGDLRPPA